MRTRSFLFLQGPISPFFRELGAALAARGHAVRRINLSLGDSLFWNNDRSEDFRGRPAEWPAHIAARMRELAVTDLVLLGEQRPQHRVAIAAAQARGVAVTATDFGYLRPDWIILERDGLNALSHYPRERAAILALAEGLPPPDMTRRHPDRFRLQAMWDVVFHLANTLPWPFRHYESFLLHPPLPAYLGTGWRLLRRGTARRRAEAALAAIPPDAPVFLFAMQMETDYSIRAYSPYPDLDTPLAEAIASFAAHAPAEARLVVKLHPLDPGLKRWDARVRRLARAQGVKPRVRVVDAVPLDPLIARARGLLTVNSTAGLRALQLGRPVLALGEALYRLPGLTHQAGLDAFWRAPEQPEPELTDAFLRGIAHHLHIRGDFYGLHGRRVAVAEAVARLERGAGPPTSPTPSASSP
jgi:capsular polysaccharide export protein